MSYSPEEIGRIVKQKRKSLGITQTQLAMASGTGLRFIVELEKGKPTLRLGKVLTVLETLGIKIEIVP